MKYLKLYEAHTEKSLDDWLMREYKSSEDLSELKTIDCTEFGLTSLKGVEKLTSLKKIVIFRNSLTSLKGIENCPTLEDAVFSRNKIENIDGVENLINLKELAVGDNQLKNLKGIENLTKLTHLYCWKNKLKNLEEIKNLKLEYLECVDNDWEFPLPVKNVDFMRASRRDSWISYIYSTSDIEKFSTYDYQKQFIEEHPERIIDLIPIGFNDKIKEEYKELLSFFNVVI